MQSVKMDIPRDLGKREFKPVAKTSEMIFRNEYVPAFSINTTVDESLEKKNPNPMLLSPVIRCIHEFLSVEDVKNCRLISHEWNSNGKIALAKRITIRFHKERSFPRLPVDFHSCFLESAGRFSAFEISGYLDTEAPKCDPWTTEELKKFFDNQQKYIKKLTLNFKLAPLTTTIFKTTDISSWISKSPMVKNDVKHMTKLAIEGNGRMLDIPLHLVANIKELTLVQCRIHIEPGVKICSTKLKLLFATYFQNGIELDFIRINDIVDFCKAKEVSLYSSQCVTKYVVDLQGNVTLDKFLLLGVFEIVNGETSQWAIKQLATMHVPYFLNSRMQIKELYMWDAGTMDLFTLPKSIQKLTVRNFGADTTVNCSEPIVWENLQYLHIYRHNQPEYYYSFASHLVNCPQLTHLKLDGFGEMEMKSIWMPKSVKTLILRNCPINWVDDSYLNLEKLIIYNPHLKVSSDHCKGKIWVDDIICTRNIYAHLNLDAFLEIRNALSFGKRLYVGEFKWEEVQLEDCLLQEFVDVESAFYVFENGEKGSAISEKDFYDLIPKHLKVNHQ